MSILSHKISVHFITNEASNIYIYVWQNLFCPFEIFANLLNCFISLSNLWYKNSFKDQKRFPKRKKGWKKNPVKFDSIILCHPVLAAIFSQTLQKWQKIVQWPTTLPLLLFGPFPIKKTLLFPYDHLDTRKPD